MKGVFEISGKSRYDDAITDEQAWGSVGHRVCSSVVVAEGIESLGHPHLRQFLTEQEAMLDLMCDSNEQRARVLNTMWSQAHGGPVLQEMELPNLDFPDAFS